MPFKPNKPYEMRNIVRVDRKSKRWNTESHAWWVRFLRKGVKTSHWFEDNKFGSKEKSLEAAMLYRDAVEKQFGGPVIGGHTITANVDKNNLVGVSRRIRIVNYKSGPVEFPVWIGTWSISPNKKKRAHILLRYC